MKIILVGFCVSARYFDKYTAGDAAPQVAAFKLERRFLHALRLGGAEVNTISTVAVSTYPRNPYIYLPGYSKPASGGIKEIVRPLVNLPFLKLTSRFIGVLGALFAQAPREAQVLCVYSAHSPNLLAAYIYSAFTSSPYYVYVPDLPVYMGLGVRRSFFINILKRIDAKFIDFLLAKAAGLIISSKHMVDDNPVFRYTPSLVVEGISEQELEVAGSCFEPLLDFSGKKVIFYAGGVNRSYGVVELVEGFKRSGSSCELWLCGRGDLEEYLMSEARINQSIKYLGFLPPAQVHAIQRHAAILALTRDPAEKYTRYSFPSKLLEYLSSGVPVMSTRLDGVPLEYYSYLNVIEDFSIDGIAEKIAYLDRCDCNELFERARAAREWVLREKTSAAVGKKIVNFMEVSCG